ncbi:MAG: hypothetical protein DMF62_04790 [Acidobacteria bacterium]|nr:MAG: hypothetical protein DMF62_04790 [Acidobacteriota bacterium]
MFSDKLLIPNHYSTDDIIKKLGQAGGGARGYNEMADLITETIDHVPLADMWAEFSRTIAMWNRQRSTLVNLLTFDVSNPIENVRYPVQEDFQEASEYGEPTGIRLGPAFQMGFDFKWWDLAIRYTWMFLAETSSEQLAALNNQAMEADNRLLFTKIFKRIFNNTTNTATIEGNSFNVYPFYNGDTMVPPSWKNIVHTTGHNHYFGSNGATVDAGDIQAMINQLTHHGYSLANGYRLILLVNQQEGAVIRTLQAGVAGSLYTFIPGEGVGGGVFLPANSGIVGRPNIVNYPGLQTIGTYGPVVVVEEEYIPAGYMVMLASGGELDIRNPVGIRQHDNASLRGLRLVKGRTPDYPLIDSFYLHGFGTGVRQRGAGVVQQVVASASYTIPSQYA